MIRYFLDLDNTVTASRQKIGHGMKAVLARFKGPEAIIIVSGAGEEQIKYQLDGFPANILSQNGNVNDLWQRYLTQEEKQKIHDHIALYAQPKDDTVEDRGAQISYSFTGHHADILLKKRFDPDGDKRRRILDAHPMPDGIEAKIGGTTCIDYFPAGLNKGANIYRYIIEKGWKIHNCIYVGDALFPGGNDESVIGVIPTFPVKGYQDTERFMSI
jgi:HAD superfamily hydrolase (TIGR01484 family)